VRISNFSDQINIPEYSQALLTTESRKTCTNLAKTLNKPHDSLYYPFRDPIANKEKTQSTLVEIAQKELNLQRIKLIFDDSQITKQYAKDIEGLDVGFDGSTGHAELGLQMITALLTDGNIKLPIDLLPYISKQIAGSHFKSKSEIAAKITTFLVTLFNIDLLLADAHYATKFFLSFLFDLKQAFLMKIPCNRIVTIGSQTAQLKKILRLRKNERVRCVQGHFNGKPYYFYVAKIKDGTIVYFVSLNQIDPYKVIELYRIRWNIELYHRVAKQYLGWKDCQMQALEKQELHSFFVMLAYAIAELTRVKQKLKCTEEAIRWLADPKVAVTDCQLFASGENLC
jgi:hypothetical protein